MAIFSLMYIIYVHLYLVYEKNGIKGKSVFNVTNFEKISKMVTLTCILSII